MKTITAEIVIPDWANWMAIQVNGDCYVYEFVPVWDYEFECWVNQDGEYDFLFKGISTENSKETLKRI